jgi:hypothetical protein
LDQLVDALHSGGTSSFEIDRSAARHGHDLSVKGFTVSQVVHDYGDVCQTITELAMKANVSISTEDFRMLNQCLDTAIAGAVTIYARESRLAWTKQKSVTTSAWGFSLTNGSIDRAAPRQNDSAHSYSAEQITSKQRLLRDPSLREQAR